MAVSVSTIGKIIGLKRGSHHFPRFLYHMTSKAKYEAIVKSGGLIPKPDAAYGKEGIFTFDLKNFFTRWSKNVVWGGEDLKERLFNRVVRMSSGDMVILRIPTAGLNKDKLRIRSQNQLFSFCKSSVAHEIFSKVSLAQSEKANAGKAYWELVSPFMTSPKQRLLVDGEKASLAKLFKQRKEAIEYIYQDAIPLGSFEKIGEANAKDFLLYNRHNYANPVQSLLQELLKGTPEQKAVEFIV